MIKYNRITFKFWLKFLELFSYYVKIYVYYIKKIKYYDKYQMFFVLKCFKLLKQFSILFKWWINILPTMCKYLKLKNIISE